MNLGDPELELIDPTPNVHNLFIQFDNLFFWTKLASRAVVRWSKRMYSCAGICSYEGRGGLCDIALSEPLLKLRPRKNLVETLLHEMIHAYLFVTSRDRDRDGHGPIFQSHMHRINKAAGINITIYHDFHDEVKLYQTHVWRCNGPCQQQRPYFGIVRRTANRAPGKSDNWWEYHKRTCGGNFIKIKEPDKPVKTTSKKASTKPNADITRYVKTGTNVPPKSVLKDSNTIPTKTKSNGGNTLVITKKTPMYNPIVDSKRPPDVFTGKGRPLVDVRQRSNSVGVLETVRSVWANKQLPSNPAAVINTQKKTPNTLNNTYATNRNTKHKAESHKDSPLAKVPRIDDYFKKTATNVLKDVYGQDFKITQTSNSKYVAVVDSNKKTNEPSEINVETSDKKQITLNKPTVNTKSNNIDSKPLTSAINLVSCPVCNAKISSNDINTHLDECLNKEVIEKFSKNAPVSTKPTPSTSSQSKAQLKKIYGKIPEIPKFQARTEIFDNFINETRAASSSVVKDNADLVSVQEELNTAIVVLENDIKNENSVNFDEKDIEKVKAIYKKITYDKFVKKTENLLVPNKEPNNVDVGFLPSFLDDVAIKIEPPVVKIEPGTSKDIISQIEQKCACCGKKMDKPLDEHLDECLAFFQNNDSIPEDRASTSFANETIVIDDDDDDIFDESQIFNATGTKTPCPCCLTMVEEAEMNGHLDQCLSE